MSSVSRSQSFINFKIKDSSKIVKKFQPSNYLTKIPTPKTFLESVFPQKVRCLPSILEIFFKLIYL